MPIETIQDSGEHFAVQRVTDALVVEEVLAAQKQLYLSPDHNAHRLRRYPEDGRWFYRPLAEDGRWPDCDPGRRARARDAGKTLQTTGRCDAARVAGFYLIS